MDWPEELLEIFDDPLLADVRPKPKAPTSDDRLAQKLLEVNKWVAEHGSEPKAAENGGYPPTQNGDIRSLFWLFSLMALQN